ncbi:hypothetical protein HF324_00665 [Chitinophaga oryzae]|uniref:Uncharacterized protein n=1 Tax=Chitinophaga oryzae TaxID=2725414 RepID=A0AAE7D4X4_9BACT|nr:hypothetical protein [Chitinophaga oryzae]QJB29953.1 hypothetical protein HF329_00965 [Chitinophaga oryzae]QJB36449.1 hypothetical protein HF324_00665 [Chitinophaga oryzae]
MFSNLAIDVALGLIFIYLLYSLLASIVQEMIARLFNARARVLTKALRRLLEDDDRSGDLGVFGRFTFFNWFYELGWSVVHFFAPFQNGPFLKKFYQSPSIRYLGENSASARPAYISPQIFSQAMVHLLRGQPEGQQPETAAIRASLAHNTLHLAPDTLTHLRNLFEDAHHQVPQFRINMETWFNETMSRASGWYKRQTQVWLLVLGLGIAAVFNVDTIAIARILMKDKNVREQMVRLVASRGPSYTVITDTLTRKHLLHRDSSYFRQDTATSMLLKDTALIGVYAVLRQDAGDAKNVLGISRACVTDTTGGKKELHCGFTHPYQQNGWLVLGGWGITALAISLGAPFWFDLLGRVVKFRNLPPQQGNTKGE